MSSTTAIHARADQLTPSWSLLDAAQMVMNVLLRMTRSKPPRIAQKFRVVGVDHQPVLASVGDKPDSIYFFTLRMGDNRKIQIAATNALGVMLEFLEKCECAGMFVPVVAPKQEDNEEKLFYRIVKLIHKCVNHIRNKIHHRRYRKDYRGREMQRFGNYTRHTMQC